MIEGTQALLQRQMENNKPIEGQETKSFGGKQVPSGQENLVPTNETKKEGPQQTKNRRRWKRTSKQVNIAETPTEIHESKPIREMVDKSKDH